MIFISNYRNIVKYTLTNIFQNLLKLDNLYDKIVKEKNWGKIMTKDLKDYLIENYRKKGNTAQRSLQGLRDELTQLKNLDKSFNFNETELAIINKSDDYLKNALDQLALAMLCISNIHNISDYSDEQDNELIK